MEEVFYTNAGNKCFLIGSPRKTIMISINHNLDIKVKIPFNASFSKVCEIINLKDKWIQKKVRELRENPFFESEKKKYTEGEFFYFLGKKRQLVLNKGKLRSFTLEKNKIVYTRSKVNENVKKHLRRWFYIQALEIFQHRLNTCFPIFVETLLKRYRKSAKEVPLKPELIIRKMKSRYGSLKNKRIMTLNCGLIHAPEHLIDYVIFHELCHLKYTTHGKNFYLLNKLLIKNFEADKKELFFFTKELDTLF